MRGVRKVVCQLAKETAFGFGRPTRKPDRSVLSKETLKKKGDQAPPE